jgi:hypothetical protein
LAFYKAFYYGYKNVKKKVKVLPKCICGGDDCISVSKPNSIKPPLSPQGGGNLEDLSDGLVLEKG